jgi:hypothetical protein
MLAKRLWTPILRDEALTRGLGDPEARVLVEWLVDQAEEFAGQRASDFGDRFKWLCCRGRAIGRFVLLWGRGEWGAAAQLAATERFAWPLPNTAADPCVLMQEILSCEAEASLVNRGSFSAAR